MLVFGVDAHKRIPHHRRHRRTRTPIGQRVIKTTSDDHLMLVAWATQLGDQRLWAVEDCRHLSDASNATCSAPGNASFASQPR